MTFNRVAWASADATIETMTEASAPVDYRRARDFATECWRRALRQRVRVEKRKAA
ncbi:MAG: hypothetical protein ABFS30_14395 [Pseudomonadota bacterium]